MDSDLLKAPSSSEFYFPSLMSAGTSCSYGGLFGAEEGWFQIMINWCDFPSKFLSIWSGGGYLLFWVTSNLAKMMAQYSDLMEGYLWIY